MVALGGQTTHVGCSAILTNTFMAYVQYVQATAFFSFLCTVAIFFVNLK
jgi:hypothetical protein